MAKLVLNGIYFSSDSKAKLETIADLTFNYEASLIKMVPEINLLAWLPLDEDRVANKFKAVADDFEATGSNDPIWYQANWYQYNIENFGTKWVKRLPYGRAGWSSWSDWVQLEISNKNNHLYEYNLVETAWAPLNENFIRAMAKKYAIDVVLVYGDEAGNYGAAGIINGVYDEIEFQIKDQDKQDLHINYWNQIPTLLEQLFKKMQLVYK